MDDPQWGRLFAEKKSYDVWLWSIGFIGSTILPIAALIIFLILTI